MCISIAPQWLGKLESNESGWNWPTCGALCKWWWKQKGRAAWQQCRHTRPGAGSPLGMEGTTAPSSDPARKQKVTVSTNIELFWQWHHQGQLGIRQQAEKSWVTMTANQISANKNRTHEQWQSLNPVYLIKAKKQNKKTPAAYLTKPDQSSNGSWFYPLEHFLNRMNFYYRIPNTHTYLFTPSDNFQQPGIVR